MIAINTEKKIQGTCEITTGAFTPQSNMPVFQGENGVVLIEISMTRNGQPYAIPSDAQARFYVHHSTRQKMTPQTAMTIAGSTVSGVMGSAHTLLSGTPDLVILLLDAAANLLVSCKIPIRVIETRSGVVLYENPVPPGVTIYVGRSPYVGEDGYWYEWDDNEGVFVRTDAFAKGTVSFAMLAIAEDGNLYLYADGGYDGPLFRIVGDDLEVYRIAEY